LTPAVFDTGADEQHRYLADLFDPVSTARLARTGVGDGWHCLEVGAGGGSVATWLAARVTPAGRVLATDLEPGHIPAADCLEVARHDIIRDPLPEAAYDHPRPPGTAPPARTPRRPGPPRPRAAPRRLAAGRRVRHRVRPAR
jgi:hypothetical protein